MTLDTMLKARKANNQHRNNNFESESVMPDNDNTVMISLTVNRKCAAVHALCYYLLFVRVNSSVIWVPIVEP